MDELTTHIQELPWCILFAKNVALVDEFRDDVNARLERWRKDLESKGLKIKNNFKKSRTNTKYMNCNFRGDEQRDVTPMRTEAQETSQIYFSGQLGYIISRDGETEGYKTQDKS